MSLNTSNTPDGRGVLIYNGEMILLYTKNVGMSFSGYNGTEFCGGKRHGSLYLTSHRVIFMNGKTSDTVRSFAMPFFSLQDVTLEQPLMGSNYLKGRIQALPGGNFSGEVVWKLSFPKGGCIDFGQALLHAVARVSHYRGSAPPSYHEPPAWGSYQQASANVYNHADNYYGFKPPTHIFNEKPAYNDVYVTDAPPPYPGIAPEAQPLLPQPQPQPGYPQLPPYPYPSPYPAGPYGPSSSASAPPYPGYAQAPPLPQKQ